MSFVTQDGSSLRKAGTERADVSIAKVFISYSRKDSEFVDQLAVALDAAGISALVDRGEVGAFEDWWERIKALIVRCDAFLAVVSPQSIDSRVCKEEISFAAALNKRLAPILLSDAEIRSSFQLRHLNFIDTNKCSFEDLIETIAEFVRSDIAWVRMHTDVTYLARQWEINGRQTGYLLRTPLLQNLEQWRDTKPTAAPELTDLQKTFLVESRKGLRRRILYRVVASAAAAIAVILVTANIAIIVILSMSDSARQSIADGIFSIVRPRLSTEDILSASLDRAKRLEQDLERNPTLEGADRSLFNIYEEIVNAYYVQNDRRSAAAARSKQYALVSRRYVSDPSISNTNRMIWTAARLADSFEISERAQRSKLDQYAIRLFEEMETQKADDTESNQSIIRAYARRATDMQSDSKPSEALRLSDRAMVASQKLAGRRNEFMATAGADRMTASEKQAYQSYVDDYIIVARGIALLTSGQVRASIGETDSARGLIVQARDLLESVKNVALRRHSEGWLILARQLAR